MMKNEMESNATPCPDNGTFLKDYHGELRSEDRLVFETHLKTCKSCQRRRDQINLENAPVALYGSFSPHKKVDHYRLDDQPLGKGGFGEVYKAFDEETGKYVALKKIDLVPSGARVEDMDSRRKRVEREVTTLRRINHDNVVRVLSDVLDFDEHRHVYFTMELIEGIDLGSYITEKRENGSLDFKEILTCMIQMSNAVSTIHDRDVVHRDIKPDNFMIDKAGRIILVDFGLGFINAPDQTRLTQTYEIMGTRGFWSPEHYISPEEVGKPADIYSLGCMFYWLLCGTEPFSDILHNRCLALMKGRPISLLDHLPNGKEDDRTLELLDELICHMLRFTYDKRPNIVSVSEVLKNPVPSAPAVIKMFGNQEERQLFFAKSTRRRLPFIKRLFGPSSKSLYDSVFSGQTTWLSDDDLLNLTKKLSRVTELNIESQSPHYCGFMLLEWAALNEADIRPVHLILGFGADIDSRNSDGRTLLFQAVPSMEGAPLSLMRFLLENGANPNALDKDWETPLMHAVKSNNPEALRLLLDYGAEINIRGKHGYTPLTIIEKEADGRTPTHIVYSEIVDEMIARGGDLNMGVIAIPQHTEKPDTMSAFLSLSCWPSWNSIVRFVALVLVFVCVLMAFYGIFRYQLGIVHQIGILASGIWMIACLRRMVSYLYDANIYRNHRSPASTLDYAYIVTGIIYAFAGITPFVTLLAFSLTFRT